MLRGSVNSVVGAASGLNVPIRAVERLTSAVEHAAAILERVERATAHLDADFIDRLNDALELLGDMQADTHAIRQRLDALEKKATSRR